MHRWQWRLDGSLLDCRHPVPRPLPCPENQRISFCIHEHLVVDAFSLIQQPRSKQGSHVLGPSGCGPGGVRHDGLGRIHALLRGECQGSEKAFSQPFWKVWPSQMTKSQNRPSQKAPVMRLLAPRLPVAPRLPGSQDQLAPEVHVGSLDRIEFCVWQADA